MPIRAAIITISDRSYNNVRPDLSGPAIVKLCEDQNWEIVDRSIVPDEFEKIREKLIYLCDKKPSDVVLTTGGTGFAPRDITPEATLSIIHRNAPGIAEAMRNFSLQKTPHAMLSRSVTGIRNNTLIINLPGSPKAAIENLSSIIQVIPHAVELLQNHPDSELGHIKY